MARYANADKDQALKATGRVCEATLSIDLAAAIHLNRVGLYKAFSSKHELPC